MKNSEKTTNNNPVLGGSSLLIQAASFLLLYFITVNTSAPPQLLIPLSAVIFLLQSYISLNDWKIYTTSLHLNKYIAILSPAFISLVFTSLFVSLPFSLVIRNVIITYAASLLTMFSQRLISQKSPTQRLPAMYFLGLAALILLQPIRFLSILPTMIATAASYIYYLSLSTNNTFTEKQTTSRLWLVLPAIFYQLSIISPLIFSGLTGTILSTVFAIIPASFGMMTIFNKPEPLTEEIQSSSWSSLLLPITALTTFAFSFNVTSLFLASLTGLRNVLISKYTVLSATCAGLLYLLKQIHTHGIRSLFSSINSIGLLLLAAGITSLPWSGPFILNNIIYKGLNLMLTSSISQYIIPSAFISYIGYRIKYQQAEIPEIIMLAAISIPYLIFKYSITWNIHTITVSILSFVSVGAISLLVTGRAQYLAHATMVGIYMLLSDFLFAPILPACTGSLWVRRICAAIYATIHLANYAGYLKAPPAPAPAKKPSAAQAEPDNSPVPQDPQPIQAPSP